MTIIVADTTCSLPRRLLIERGIPFVPQVVIFGEEAYHDDADFDTAVFLKKLKASATLPRPLPRNRRSTIRSSKLRLKKRRA